jgi:beta-glucosidase
VDRIRLRAGAGWLQVPVLAAEEDSAARGAEGALDPALLAGRTDLAPLTCGEDPTEFSAFALVEWGDGVLTLRAADGRYLSVAEDGFVRASADQPGGWVIQETFTLEEHDGGHLLKHTGTGRYVTVATGGVKVADEGEVFRVEFTERGEDAVAAVAAAADVVIVVAGNDPHINGRETEDRTTLALPPHQDRLWRAALAANPRTALVLVSAYPYAIDDTELPAVAWTAHGGQAAGRALARVLAGDVSPAGRLPQTWYADDADLPDLFDYDIIGSRQTYLYYEGTPRYPFGHGLSYSSFRYEDLTAAVDGESVRVSFTVTNTGAVDADEVAQLYTRAVDSPVAQPVRKLVAHRRLRLAARGAERLEFTLPRAELGHWDVAHGRWTVPAGAYELLAGASSADIRLVAGIEVPGEPAGPRPVRERGLEAADYDEQHGTLIVDRTKVSGDAVTPVGEAVGELVFRDCDFGDHTSRITVEAAGEGSVELALDGGEVLATLDLAATAGPYDYAPVEASMAASGVGDLRVTLRGAVRLARLGFSG